MEDSCSVQCPYCFEVIELYVDPATEGEYVEDCEVCCRPWLVRVARGEHQPLRVEVQRAQ